HQRDVFRPRGPPGPAARTPVTPPLPPGRYSPGRRLLGHFGGKPPVREKRRAAPRHYPFGQTRHGGVASVSQTIQALLRYRHRADRRAAAHARAARARRRECERRATPMGAAEPTPAVLWEDLRPVLDEEVGRLPEEYRVPVVLCYLDGLTYAEAAREIGCPKG